MVRMPLPHRSLAPLGAFVLATSALFTASVATAQGTPPPSSSARANLLPDGTVPAPSATTTATAPVTPPPPPSNTAATTTDTTKPEPAADGTIGTKPSDVYSDEWWGRTRPALEVHGYFRTRAELFHNFTLGRRDAPGSEQYLWPQPLDNSYTAVNGVERNVALCGDDGKQTCTNNTQAGANLRFRLNPELHISDSLRIFSQIDMLDNLVLGSTPDVYAMKPNAGGSGDNGSGYTSAGYNGYAPLSGFATTQGPPTAGVNGYVNSIAVKRAWAEFMTPVGQLRFGRMPNQWGLGILANSGDGIDSDYQSTNDRIMFVTGIKSLDLYVAGMWDFVNTGPNSSSPYDLNGGQPYSTSNLNNVNQWGIVVAHRTNPEAAKLTLARGGLVLNGGVFTVLRTQYLDTLPGQTPLTTDSHGTTVANGFEKREAWAVIPDLWVQALYKKFRFEAEAVMIYGEARVSSIDNKNPTKIRQFGFAAQTEYLAVEDKLHLNFGFGWASGDPWVEGLNPGPTGLQPEKNGAAISTFHFHPDYRVDLIFFRRILTRVEGAYYFRPSVDYDFLHNANGQKFGGGAALIWSRASDPVQAPGNKPDLGVELDVQLYFQAKDGSLNDDPKKVGGFYTMLQYGVFFPLGGLGYLAKEQTPSAGDLSLSAAQTIRWYMGVVY
ncbi:hypothetical protein BH09MYX1_BH09MYX1_41060 [soil metagenome]